ncbi:uncharacterized protein LOC117169378 isoform X2 [Belonocnema kinseyi]|uniref:uncharacterized protein LOC117169378 isoform X2 n=1 Tax=Belonocnema kinseyi TaxID=2817044 RepID=UPI00143DADD0|nr:uncharacterized protein LOC117169378 isoform X2 [Belonocnema kinseyi]
MKKLISTLLPLLFVICLGFGELIGASNMGAGSNNPAGGSGNQGKRPSNPESSSSDTKKREWKKRNRGGRVPDPIITPPRVSLLTYRHDGTFSYEDKTIYVWTDANMELAQANFPGMITQDYEAYKPDGLLIGLDSIGGQSIVIYKLKNGTLIGVRAPRRQAGNFLEPSANEWFIINNRIFWKLYVRPVQTVSPDDYPRYRYNAVGIELLLGKNKRQVLIEDKKEKVEFPLGITFCIYKRHLKQLYPEVMGAFIPQANKVNENGRID